MFGSSRAPVTSVGRFVVAVSFAEGNVRANGACDRVVRVVQCRGNSVAGAA